VVQSDQRRAPLELEEDRLQTGLREQLRLGAGANQDSTARLLGALNKTRADLAAMDQDEMHDLGAILSPVQQAQWQVLRDRFRQMVRAVARQQPDSGRGTPEP
jgi:hypothetical protein